MVVSKQIWAGKIFRRRILQYKVSLLWSGFVLCPVGNDGTVTSQDKNTFWIGRQHLAQGTNNHGSQTY